MSEFPTLDRNAIQRCTVQEADEASGWVYWRTRSPRERLQALEQLRRLSIQPNPDGSLPRLQRVLTVLKRGEG